MVASVVEGLTEAGQSAVQQIGTELAVDKTVSEAFNSLNWDQIFKEGTAGALIGGPIGGFSSPGVKFSSSDVEAMIEENDIGAIQQFTEEGLIDFRTLPNKTRSKIGFTTQKVGDRTFTYPSTILNQDAVPPKVEVDVKEDVDIEEQVEEIEEVKEDPIPEEISSLKDDEDIVFKVDNIEDVPPQYRDRVKESSSGTITTRETIFGFPIGKEKTENITNRYYILKGKEVKDQYKQQANEQTTTDPTRS